MLNQLVIVGMSIIKIEKIYFPCQYAALTSKQDDSLEEHGIVKKNRYVISKHFQYNNMRPAIIILRSIKIMTASPLFMNSRF